MEKLEAYYAKERPFKGAINKLRELAAKTNAVETLKWGSPVYVADGKNVFWIARFKNHFGLGFFNGVFLKDPKKVLINAQEAKTQAMRHWHFKSIEEINDATVIAYMNEAIDNQLKGMRLIPEKKKKTKLVIPKLLQDVFSKNIETKKAFDTLTPYKQKEYAKHIISAKQEKTKLSRLEKIIPMINAGLGLNDKYRNC
ncbi:YdeI/OmpD-associated family protein [Maribacter sp. HTCC2170]|uniref:YdeI/OmpD-associated family protein n=1 Tax=Maribacter sp. (strain HTCC2170 / KCCM 42371) TaxID=313603 RepID=UPI00006B2114|nr:DUF1801 domain-containing protein [Maribacter sp. HTCC2170]EAR00202.1 hypothetical protein FB2170_01010 [Maribacter sp. HTCC2170]